MADDVGAGQAVAVASERKLPVEYSPELADEILEAVAHSRFGLAQLCAAHRDDWPGERQIWRWRHLVPGFAERWQEAKERQAAWMAYEAIAVAYDDSGDAEIVRRQDGSEDVRLNAEFAARSKLKAETLRWAAGKLAPRDWGEKVQVDATVGPRHEDFLALLR